ncbi:hypothetical protein MGG_09137 [Pyricularia oryzae 70-15]|uniref:Uncharacterized protein n=3 Tax=Pyricularia oryzae TaxID=318829 RepID=Q2KEU5_PYRO7|nr:uncharacterized protein MGG_09137 [Pyricularia oryzae 70-15]EAQ71534.1 hypothetical protein MGCH7_ch7g941 [Pyricularia oryzae 70-15]ELQ44852.1 hypothetical protein OOU_Y34scaffold00042g2 [Pyricularia oryzae Y34]KAI7910980.1 hypothetical protein M0657_011158 [Pyricularia oryzae]KYQ30457.1 hypothetical protein MGG_09137 [Pyricularia oryzae 70-15]
MFYAPATFEIFPNLFFRLEHSFCSAFAMMRHQWTFLLSGILISVCAARFLPPLSLERRSGRLLPRANIFVDMNEVKVGSTADTVSTMGLATCIGAVAYGTASRTSTNKVMVHATTAMVDAKLGEWSRAVNEAGIQNLRIFLSLPSPTLCDSIPDDKIIQDLQFMGKTANPGSIAEHRRAMNILLVKANRAAVVVADSLVPGPSRTVTRSNSRLGSPNPYGTMEATATHVLVEGTAVDTITPTPRQQQDASSMAPAPKATAGPETVPKKKQGSTPGQKPIVEPKKSVPNPKLVPGPGTKKTAISTKFPPKKGGMLRMFLRH